MNKKWVHMKLCFVCVCVLLRVFKILFSKIPAPDCNDMLVNFEISKMEE